MVNINDPAEFCGKHFQSASRVTVVLEDAFALFKRLGVDVQSISAREFTAAYFVLAKRYHPDLGNQQTQDLMANINAARTEILKCRRVV